MHIFHNQLFKMSRIIFFIAITCSSFTPRTNSSKYYSEIFKRVPKRPCDEETLVSLLAEIQIVSPETIINLSTLEDVKPLCKRISENLEKLEEHLSNCEPPHQPDLYRRLVKGEEILYRKLCSESVFKKQFKEFFPCFHKIQKEFEKCNGEPDWIEKSDPADICDQYKKIAKCYFDVAGKNCGKEAADIMQELVITIINSILTVKCNLNENGGNPEDDLEMAAGPDKTKGKKEKPLPKLKGIKGRAVRIVANYNFLIIIICINYLPFV